MINQVLITNLADAESYSYKDSNVYNIWITAVDNEDNKKVSRMKKNFRKKGVKYYAQFFSDWSDEDGIQWGHLMSSAPTETHMKNYISFLKPFAEDDRQHSLGVNCFAGISRSSALALTALVMSGKTIEQALTYVLEIRPEAWPNLRMLGFASDILGKDIKTHVQNWKKNVLGLGNIITSYDDLRKLNK